MVVGLVTQREKDIECFYGLLALLEERVGGKRTLEECDGQEGWPQGVYFFFENGEFRSEDCDQLRVVRVGTHGTKRNSPSTLWWRLTQHKNDVGRSVFRDHLSKALQNRSRCKIGEIKYHNHQTCVSQYIGRMPFLWVKVEGQDSHLLRDQIERNSIGLLSFWRKDSVGQPSDNWLGKWRNHKLKKVEKSGLWNVNFVTKGYDATFLEDLKRFVGDTQPLKPREDSWDSPMCLGEES